MGLCVCLCVFHLQLGVGVGNKREITIPYTYPVESLCTQVLQYIILLSVVRELNHYNIRHAS